MSEEQSMSPEALIKAVHDAYSAKARVGTDHEYAHNVAQAFGYTLEQLQSIPDESHMGLSCGNPVATATIKEGEVILDLGSGGGIDVFLAASKAGPHGQVIGLDMSADMILLARRNAQGKGLRPPQVSFVQASLTEPLPISSNSVDCILSNCVINLLPLEGKASVLKEAYRVLKPGGRIVLDDIVAKQPLPDNIRTDLSAYVGCIAGAISIEDYKDLLVDAEFRDSLFVDTRGDINAYRRTEGNTTTSGCCSGSSRCTVDTSPFDANVWVASYQIYAVKDSGATATSETGAPPTPLSRWWDAYPTVKSSPASRTCEEVAAMMQNPNRSDYAIIDVRRNDHAGGHVRGSFQWPAQTFYDDRAAFLEKFGTTSQVIFYCSSSHGRGPRCAGWYQDYLNELLITKSVAYVMEGGVKAWLENDAELVDHDDDA